MRRKGGFMFRGRMGGPRRRRMRGAGASGGKAVLGAAILTLAAASAADVGPAQTNRLIEITGQWRYHVGKQDLGDAWRAPDYDDSGWAAGGGLLYVENSDLPAPKTTPLPLTPRELPAACYFRARFTNDLVNVHSIRLIANTVIDDGAVVYLNGAEALRLGMPEGEIAYGTRTARTVGDAAWEGPFELPTGSLRPGVNVVAVEVHQTSATSSDIVMGMTLDAVWRANVHDTNPPVVLRALPEEGAAVATLTQIELWFDEPVAGVDAGDLLVNGSPASSVTAVAADHYVFRFAAPPPGRVEVAWAPDHGITDLAEDRNPFAGAGFSYTVDPAALAEPLPFASVAQSSDASPAHAADRATDGANSTFSLTADAPGSFWRADLARAYSVSRVVLVNRPAPDDAEFAGLTLRLFNMDDQTVFETVLTNPGPSGVATVALPAGTKARSLWIGLPGDSKNGAGNRRVGLAEVRLYGRPGIPFGPEPWKPPEAVVRVWQSSEYPGFPAENAVDGDTGNFTHTDDLPDSYWMADLGRVVPLDKIEVVNRRSCCAARLGGLTLRLYDGSSNTVAVAQLANPGLGGTWSFTPPAGAAARWIRIGLEEGRVNEDGNHYVSLAEVRAFSGGVNVLRPQSSLPPAVHNLASGKRSYMLRLEDSLPPASNANDDDCATQAQTTSRTVDGYWEVDLGETLAVYGVRAIAASGIGGRLTNATVRLYDAEHKSVYAQPVAGEPDVFDVDLNGPHFARYVRVGLENKRRTDPSGGIEWWIGFREVEVFGRPTNEVGILSFTVSTNRVAPGGEVALSWKAEDVRRVELHPGVGSVGAYTAPDGSGQITLPVRASTEFVLVAEGSAGVFARAVSVQAGDDPLPVRISELAAENKYSLKDGFGESPDWIELRNTGNEPVNLAGWGLSDEADRPMKWTFPSVTIAPHGTLIVFASGRDEAADPAGFPHAGFRLDKNGGLAILTPPGGAGAADRAEYPELDVDLAYGRDLDGAWTFLEPTPGAVNTATAWEGWLKQPSWSHPRGFYETNFVLTLTNNSPGSTLLYSLDGGRPDRPYTGGLPIQGTTVVRVQAVRPGWKPSRVATRTFLFVDDVIASPVLRTSITHNPAYAPRLRQGLLALPSISLAAPGQPEYEEKEGSVEILWPDGREPVQINCGLSRFGNAWTKFEKRSFRIKCRARYGAAKLTAPLFEGFDRGVQAARSFDKLDLRSGSQDMSQRGFYMAGRFVEDSMLDMGSLNPHGRFVHVYLNGVYWGQYDCRELLDEHFLADYLGGSEEDYVVVRGNDNVGGSFVIGAPDPPHLEPWEHARSVRRSYRELREWVDVPHLIDFMLLWNYGNCETEFRACGPIEPGSGFKFWMADADGFLRTGALGKNRLSNAGPGGLFGGLLAEGDPDFKTLLADRIYLHFFHGGALTPAANDARLAARMEEIRDSLILECARWGYRTPSNWEAAAEEIRSKLFPARTAELLGYLRRAGWYPDFDPPAFNQYGGLVAEGFQPTLASSAGTIYYTVDGSDPRLPGGAVSPSAKAWSPGAVTVTNDLVLSARVRNASGQWSALAQARYFVAPRRAPGPGDLLITEIHYNPAGSDEGEFVELWNASSDTLDLSGAALSNAVWFLFPEGFTLAPGGFAVVAEDAEAFAARYQTPGSPWHFPGIRLAGVWRGALANEGENLELVAADGSVLAAVPYRPGGDWPAAADGRGSSLELIDPRGAAEAADLSAVLADGRNWRASSLYHGSPGRFDSFVSPVRINEVLSHPTTGEDWIELLNVGEEPASLAGWTLTDDLDRPERFVFPDDAALPPGCFLRLDAAQLGFGFSELGDRAALLETEGGDVIRILDQVRLPAAAPDESLGVFRRSDGATDFTELRAPTPGASNALPRVGPVVISEILFAPTEGKAEFVELANLAAQPVPLFDPLRPTNRWRLEGVGRFEFPPDTVIAPAGTLIVCSTDPAAFRAQYGVSAAVPVLGPWSGALDDDGETLELLRPGEPRSDGETPWYRADRAVWRTRPPWPEVKPGGSLVRLPLEAYGGDPAAWRAGQPGGTPGVAPPNRPPTAAIEGDASVSQGGSLTLKLAVNDPDAPWQTVSVVAEELPPGSVFDPASRTLFWNPGFDQGPGDFIARFLVRDSSQRGDSETPVEVALRVTPALRLVAEYESGRIRLTFPVQAGETYRVEFAPALGSGEWLPLQEITAAETGAAVVIDPDPPTASARFYRVVWTSAR